MSNEQQKSIKKTVWIIVAIMVSILVLFVNKITTPRYLSLIELKINGLVLLDKERRTLVQHTSSPESWILVVSDEAERQLLDDMMEDLDTAIINKISIVDEATLTLNVDIQTSKSIIPIIKPSGDVSEMGTGQYIGYLVSPYDRNKAILTLSSVITHR
jgi:hypothetical protein